MYISHEEVEPIEFDDLTIVDYTAGQDISSSLAEITVPSGVRHKLSWSKRSDKYYYIVQGGVDFTLDGVSRRLSAGDVCIVRKGARFTYENPGPEDATLVLVHTPSFNLEFEVFEA